MKNILEIGTKNWQRKINTTGEVVTQLDDISQSYDIIIATIKGEIPHHPNFGTNIIEAIDESPKEALKIIRTVIKKEFEIQEPRGEIKSVTADYTANGKLNVKISYLAKLDNTNIIREKEFTL